MYKVKISVAKLREKLIARKAELEAEIKAFPAKLKAFQKAYAEYDTVVKMWAVKKLPTLTAKEVEVSLDTRYNESVMVEFPLDETVPAKPIDPRDGRSGYGYGIEKGLDEVNTWLARLDLLADDTITVSERDSLYHLI